jgi:hypothetical protein
MSGVQNLTIMKIPAKEVQIGMDVKFGNVWLKVEDIKEKYQKNGKRLINICGTTYPGVVKRRGGGISKVSSRYCNYNEPRADTLVQIR